MSSPLPYNRQTALAATVAADNAANIAGKTVLTTGVTQGGLGATFVETIAQYKPRLLILAGRSAEKVQATVQKIKSDPKSSDVEVRILEIDLASQKSVRQAADTVLGWKDVDHIDVLVNSAGIMAGPYKTTQEGIENQFGSNHIGHFLFTNLILPKILASPSPRIVSVASDGHRFGGVRFDDWNFQDGKVYEQWEAYGQSKTANILFARALAEKLGPKGLKAYSLHPGVAFGTSLAPQGLTDEDLGGLGAKDKEIGWNRELDIKTLDECSATHVVAAFDTRLNAYNGVYLEDGNLSDDLQPSATNPADVEKLWKLSEKLVGQDFSY
ncbi:putative short-chain dehydrogenase [Boeremia exigua]|uniref:putative short-chain dehydrogenase n=1 Tax=Boeremia exigua TaxID=749465 RepID=UPI001E8CA31F|nr:putative short-chain dehydrogenase [Boeremia exigua]KAH6639681.1 putative short-chain dehydrogenase [Boeremia exigua]